MGTRGHTASRRRHRHLPWLALVVGCGARTSLDPGNLGWFAAAGSSSAGAAAAGSPFMTGGSGGAVATAGAPATAGAHSAGNSSAGGNSAGSAGASGAAPCSDPSCVCLDPQLLRVTPANADTQALGANGVRATFSCPPHPSISRPQSMVVSGHFAGALPATFPQPAAANEVLLQALPPDPVRKSPYFPGELLTARLGMPLGGPYLWQFTAAVRAKAFVKFSDTGQALTPAMEVELADLDRDGDLDLITGSSLEVVGGERLGQVYENDGNGNFSLRATLTGVSEIFLADVDGNGELDIVSDHLFLGSGGFQFTDSIELKTVHAVFDADGDGDLDVFRVNGQEWALLRNDGTGQFTSVALDKAYVFDTQVGDLDNDGDLDLALVAAIPGTPDVYRGAVLLNDGSGSFTEIKSGLLVDATRQLALGDVDGDGDLDVFMGSWGAAGARNPADQVWLNDGTAHFSAGDAPLSGSPNLLLGDLDGDGDLDAIAGQHQPYSSVKGDPSQVLLNDGKGHFSTSGSVGGSNFQHVVLGDLDGDGDLDAAVAQWDWSLKPPVQIWLQDG
ncbi:MAG: VCBS repeat-containing protein [Polyangiaceae bacterium]